MIDSKEKINDQMNSQQKKDKFLAHFSNKYLENEDEFSIRASEKIQTKIQNR